MNFKTLEDIFASCAEMLRPPERISVSGAARAYRVVNSPGAYVGPWYDSTTPYMREPMDTFASTEFTGLIFVGPAQSAKTDGLVINTTLYSIKIDPMDMMIVCPTNTAARDFSMRRIDRLNRYSPEIGKMLLPGADNDNKFDKLYNTGMMLSLSWPTVTELAGKPVGRIVLTDRDRMPDDIDGDGEPYDLAAKRTTSFGSNAMAVAESSPSREVTDIKWIPRTPHEAPPCNGIIGLYNRGDRRRWYWPCPHCNHYFEGRFEMLKYDRKKMKPDGQPMSNLDVADTVYMLCPMCAEHIQPDDRYEMNLWGTWVKDGQAISAAGMIIGTAMRTLIASFWLRGVAAAFVTWKKLIVMYLDACDDFERTGTEESLKKFYNNDLGEPYYPRASADIRLPEDIRARADKVPEHEVRHVPEGTRFLLALIDVQKNMWVVQVFGILPGAPFDTVLIDRFNVAKSKRVDEDGERYMVKPHTYLEDWEELVEHVIDKEYPLADGSGRLMSIKLTACDSGGKEGVTGKAYEFWRSLRARNLHHRFVLVKGESTPGNPRTRISYPDSNRKDSKSAARGDIPVLMFNSNLLKDDLDGRLDCIQPGRGMYRTPDWMPTSFYNELCAEFRTEKGWEHDRSIRNEAWDLSYYCIGVCLSQYIRIETIDWANPPRWASTWETNDFIRTPEEEKPYGNAVKSTHDFAKMANALA
jgi:phage terminase large subunit GpA-like protein